MFRHIPYPVQRIAALLVSVAGTTMLPSLVAAQMMVPVCPVIVSPADPGLCQVAVLPPKYDSLFAEERQRILLLSYGDDETYHLLSRRPLFAPGDVSLLSRRDDTATLPAIPEDKIAIYSAANAAPGSLNAAYDVPFVDGLALSNTSTINQTGTPGSESRSASSGLGLAYEEYGLTFKVNPNAAANWSELAGSSHHRYGIDNSVSTMIARDLTLTLSSGYTSEGNSGDPYSVSSNQRHRIAIAQHFSSGYKLGASLQRRNEYVYQQERDLNIVGLQVGVPLGDTLNFTASHEFGIGEQRSFVSADAVPLYGRRQSLDLQLQWTPAALASRAMTIMAGYTLTEDEFAGSEDPYVTQARVNLAMKF
ncbi:MAG: hypothetical protein VW600_07800 [Ferrovibrio sp.]